MQYYGFKQIVDQFSDEPKTTRTIDYDIGKVRDKFVDIIKLVGIDDTLLRRHKDEKTGEIVSFDNSNRAFCFPETICDFCVKMIRQYTSSDLKKLRKGQYTKVAIEELSFLINGFTQYLSDLGYDQATIAEERFKMDEHLQYHISALFYELCEEYKKLVENAENYNSHCELCYADKVCLIQYMVENFKQYSEHITSVYSCYEQLRCEEVDNYALEESKIYRNTEVLTDIYQSALLADALEHDKEYQTLLKKQMKILCTPDFLKNKESCYNKNNERLDEIKKNHIRNLFSDKYQNTRPINNFTPASSLSVLHDAVKWTYDEEEMRENIPSITEEQRKIMREEITKAFPGLFDLPDIEQMEQKITKKGSIKFPCCLQEETIVYSNAAGSIVSKCPRCGKQILFNLDDMTAEIYETPVGHMALF